LRFRYRRKLASSAHPAWRGNADVAPESGERGIASRPPPVRRAGARPEPLLALAATAGAGRWGCGAVHRCQPPFRVPPGPSATGRQSGIAQRRWRACWMTIDLGGGEPRYFSCHLASVMPATRRL